MQDDLVAGILAGGQSRRLGTDKALIQWNGRSLLEWSALRASALTSDVYILAKEQSRYEGFGYPVLSDLSSTVTPLSGILSITPFVKKWLLLLACDIVLFSEDLLPLLWEKREPGKALVVRSKQGLQPFLGFYPLEQLPIWEQAYRSGNYKLQPAVEKMDKIVLNGDRLQDELGQEPLFLNINHPDELRMLRSLPIRSV